MTPPPPSPVVLCDQESKASLSSCKPPPPREGLERPYTTGGAPLQTKVTIVGENDFTIVLVGPFLVPNFLGPRPFLPSPHPLSNPPPPYFDSRPACQRPNVEAPLPATLAGHPPHADLNFALPAAGDKFIRPLADAFLVNTALTTVKLARNALGMVPESEVLGLRQDGGTRCEGGW